jgi:hypothetical protein
MVPTLRNPGNIGTIVLPIGPIASIMTTWITYEQPSVAMKTEKVLPPSRLMTSF